MRAFDVEMSRRGFASALAAGALSLALAGCAAGLPGPGPPRVRLPRTAPVLLQSRSRCTSPRSRGRPRSV